VIELREIMVMWKGRGFIFTAKAILSLLNTERKLSRGPRARHVDTVNVGTWEILQEDKQDV
jgi:hypothetical protein